MQNFGNDRKEMWKILDSALVIRAVIRTRVHILQFDGFSHDEKKILEKKEEKTKQQRNNKQTKLIVYMTVQNVFYSNELRKIPSKNVCRKNWSTKKDEQLKHFLKMRHEIDTLGRNFGEMWKFIEKFFPTKKRVRFDGVAWVKFEFGALFLARNFREIMLANEKSRAKMSNEWMQKIENARDFFLSF